MTVRQPSTRTAQELTTAGFVTVVAAVLCLSAGSSIVRKSGAPGPTIAFWRLVVATVIWHVVLRVRGLRITGAQWRRAVVPGLLFGVNITLFFTGLTHTSVAHGEFIGSLAPLVLMPLGTVLFHEHIPARALPWGTLALAGVALVIFFSPSGGPASAHGDLLCLGAMLTWTSYLLTTRRLRGDMDVSQFMGAMGPFAILTMIPVIAMRGGAFDLGTGGLVAALLLGVVTGTIAHGLIVQAQRMIPLAMIAVIQVAQPALALGWAAMLLGEDLRAPQVVGAVVVVLGLAAFIWAARARTRTDEDIALAGIHD